MDEEISRDIGNQSKKPDYFWAILFLRIGLAITLIYPAFGALLNPIAWSGFVPFWIKTVVDVKIFLFLFSFFEIVLVGWLVWGKKLYFASLIFAGLMFAITIFNLAAFEIIFRDIGLGFAALALAVLTRNKIEN